MSERDVMSRSGLRLASSAHIENERRAAPRGPRAAAVAVAGARAAAARDARRAAAATASASRTLLGRATSKAGGSSRNGAPPPQPPQSKKQPEPMRPSDVLNTEFIYYNSTLKLLVPSVSSTADRQLIAPWLEKLYSPLYNSPSLRDKRNRFLHSLLITVLNDEAFGWFRQPPPRSALPDVDDMAVYSPPACAWQADPSWDGIVATMPPELRRAGCACGGGCCQVVFNRVTEQLDDEFKFLLHLIRPHVGLYPDLGDQDKISQWIQMLCCITKEACVMMKGIRNDYMAALFGFAHNLQLSPPFDKFPDFDVQLPSLDDAIEYLDDKPSYLDPTGMEAEDFLKGLPVPEEGAFCYIALTGDLISVDQ